MLSHASRLTIYNDQMGGLQGGGFVPPKLGDQKINNTSFESGNIQPWTASSYNANASSARLISPGLNDSYAVQLTVTSGNLTSSSYERLTQDLSASQVAFSNETLLQASVEVTTLTGNTSMDRAGLILSLATSTGITVRLHYIFASGEGLPTNTTRDAYFKVAGYGSSGWISISRNLETDTKSVFPNIASSVDAVREVSLYADSMSYGNPNRDLRIKFFDHYGTGAWNSSDTVVYDSDMDGTFQTGDQVLWTGTYSPSIGDSIINDPLIKLVDLDQNGKWDTGEPIVYDCYYSSNPNNIIPGDCNNNAVDINEPVIYGNPIIGQLLMNPIRRVTTASFDEIQLYAPNINGNILINGGFETGTLVAWGNQPGFSPSSFAHTGSHSAFGSVTGGTVQLTQSIDSQPRINIQSFLQASVNIAKLTGTTSNDSVDIWLGLSDRKGTPVSLYYVFDTGNGMLPANATGLLYYKGLGFGTLNQWLNIDRMLSEDVAQFDSQGFSAPYSLDLVVLEARSQGSNTASAYFDDIYVGLGLATSPPGSSLLPWIIIIVIAAIIAGVTGFTVFYRRTRRKIDVPKKQPTQPNKLRKNGGPPPKKENKNRSRQLPT